MGKTLERTDRLVIMAVLNETAEWGETGAGPDHDEWRLELTRQPES